MKVITSRFSLGAQQKQYTIAAGIVLISYIVIYSIFLYSTDFLPYVFDNNETFSSLIHVQNLFNFGLKDSFGLTDEAYGVLKAAHPFVYTHQGNFPRLYSFLLYILGAKSAEAQIVITTFTIGLAGIWFCYHYFAKYVSCLFAVIFCLLLMSDYIMFMQWQVNTWRVWHLFFFFSSFLCCHEINNRNRGLFILISIFNFAFLFYMEIAFAVFVFFSCQIYLLIARKNAWVVKFLNILILGLGALIGLGILIAQNIAFLGWEAFLKDMSYTFLARNHVSTGTLDYVKEVTSFYSAHKIVFWENFNSLTTLRRPITAFINFYSYCLSSYPLTLTISAVVILLGSLLSGLYEVLEKNFKTIFSFRPFTVSKQSLIVCTTALYLLCLAVLIFSLYPPNWGYKKIIAEFITPFSFTSIVLLGLVFLHFCNDLFTEHSKIQQNDPVAVCRNLIVFFLLSNFTTFIILLLNHKIMLSSIVLQEHTLWVSGGTSSLPLIAGAVLFASTPLSYLYNKPLAIQTLRTLKKILPFLVATSVGFFCAYIILPGYIMSAYWARSCCFTVFAHIVLYTWLFYIVAIPLHNLYQTSKQRTLIAILKKLKTEIININASIIQSIFLLLFFSSSWIYSQLFYLQEFPPIDFNFIKLLQKTPFKHYSVVSNNYAAPFSFTTQAWAYLDPSMGYSIPTKDINNQWEVQRDFRYLWFADATNNPRYQNPKIFVCWQSYSIGQTGGAKPKCGDLPLIQFIRDKKNNQSEFIELKHDQSGRDRWSIVALPAADFAASQKLK